jgi:hypothetical protein
MVDPRYIELINRKIDDSLNEAERAELEQYLATSPEARTLHDDMMRLSSLPELLPPVDPPRELKRDILNAIAESKRRVAVPRRSEGFWHVLRARFEYKLAYSFAAGLLLGAAVIALSMSNLAHREDLRPTDLVGTIIAGQDQEQARMLDEGSFDQETFSGTVHTSTLDGHVIIQLDIQSSREATIAFEFKPEFVAFEAFRQATPYSGAVEISPEGMRFTQTGKNEYVFVLKRVSMLETEVSCQIQSGQLIFQRSIQIPEQQE